MIQIKDSGIEWIGEIPQDWDKRKLKYIAKVETGGTPPRGDDSNFDDEYGIQWIKPDNILENNTISATKEKVSIEAAKNLPIISKGSTVVCCIGTVGKCAYVSEKSVSNQQINAVTFCDEYDSRYGFYSTLISKQEYEAQANKVVVSILNKFQQSNIFYPYCKINKQQNIADYLDKKCSEIDACLSDVNASIAKLQEYKKSIITEAVTKGLDPNAEMKDSGIEWIGEIPQDWEMKKLNYIFKDIGSGTTPSSTNTLYYSDNDNDYFWLQTGDLNDGYIFETSKKITKLAVEECKSLQLFDAESIIIAMYGATIGKLGILKINSYTNQACCVLSNPQNNNSKYIFYWLLCNKDNIINLSFGGGQPNINQNIIKSLKISISPNFNTQKTIADYLDKKCSEIDNVIEEKKELANKLKEYKNSLIYECVTGKREVG